MFQVILRFKILQRMFVIEIRCSVPQPPTNGRILPEGAQSVKFNRQIMYQCVEGFRIRRNVFNSTARCQLDRTFDPPTVPSCTGKLLYIHICGLKYLINHYCMLFGFIFGLIISSNQSKKV